MNGVRTEMIEFNKREPLSFTTLLVLQQEYEAYFLSIYSPFFLVLNQN